MRRLLLSGLAGPVLARGVWGGENGKDPAGPLQRSGFQAGDKVPNFYVRAITGPLQSKSVCYVCRNGDRPVAMVLIRRIVPELQELLQGIDGVVDAHRAQGLRSFAVFIARDARMIVPQVQTLAFNGRIGLPLTVAVAPAEGPGVRGLADDTAVAVVLYRELTVSSTFAFGDEELCADSISRVVTATRDLAERENAPEK